MVRAEMLDCPVEWTRRILGDRWKVLILQNLMDGTRSFVDLKGEIPYVSHKVLVPELRELEEMGLLSCVIYTKAPPQIDFSLTETGQSLKTLLDTMRQWGETHKEKLAIAAGVKTTSETSGLTWP